jgi:hypothetical protein
VADVRVLLAGWFSLDEVIATVNVSGVEQSARGLVRRADVVVSMRLHALVLGLEHGRPVVACDPIAGGAKVASKAAALDWPLVVPAEELTATPRRRPGALPVRRAGRASARGGGAGRARAWFEEQLAR